MSRFGTTVVSPGTFAFGNARTPDSFALCLPSQGSSATSGGANGYGFATIRDMFGVLASADTMGPNALANTPQGSATNQKQYLQAIDLNAEYANRVVPFFGTFVTAAVLNFRNSFLTSIVAPFLETSEMNFTINQEEYNQVEFKKVNTAGIGVEQTYFEWGWTDTVEPYKKEARITEELALDPNFGQARYIKELQTFASTALKTADLNVIYNLLANAWRNSTYMRDRQVIGNFDVQKAWNVEGADWHIMAKDPEAGLSRIRNLEDTIDELDTVIVQDRCWQYTRGILGESVPLVGRRLFLDSETAAIEEEIFSAGDSLKTMRLGNRAITFYELKGFRINTFDKYVEHPLETRVTLCHYWGPHPNVRWDTPVISTNPDLLNIEVFYQTKSVGEQRAITMEQRLRSCHYWNLESGEVSENARAYAYRLTQDVQNNKDLVPPSWNERRTGGAGLTIEDEDTSYGYNQPDMNDVVGKKLADMNYRSQFALLTYLPDRKIFVPPKRLGDFHLAAMPNEWIHRGAKGLALDAQTRSGATDVDGIYLTTWNLLDGIRNAAVTNEYVSDLIAANSDGDNAITELTPESKLDTFPNAHIIREWKPNQYGALRLPNEADRNYGKYPAGFHFGGGLQTLADETANPNSRWREAAEEARDVLKYWLNKGTYLDQAIGRNDSIDASLTPPWIHVDSEINALIESFVGRSVPTFMAPIAGAGRARTDLLIDFYGLWLDARDNGVQADAEGFARFLDNLDDDQRRARVVSDSARVVSLLTQSVRDELMAYLASLNQVTRDAIINQVNALSALIMRVVVPEYGRGATVSEQKIIVVSSVIRDTLRRLDDLTDADEINASLRESTRRFFGNNVSEREKNENAKQALQSVGTLGTDRGFSRQLQQYERENPTNTESEQYYRAPLMWSEEMDKYITRQGENSRIVRADPTTFYETPLLTRIDAETRRYLRDMYNLGTGIHGLARKHIIQSNFSTRLSQSSPSSEPAPQQRQNVASFGTRGAAFSPLSTKSRSQKLSSLLDMGARPFDSEGYDPRVRQGGFARETLNVEDNNKVYFEYTNSLKEEYFGPWGRRLEYARKIKSPAERFFFLVLLQAYNRLDTFVNLAKLNIELIGIMVFRPFVQYNCFSMIAMKAGASTNVTAVGHAIVKVTKEHRGIYHMACEFRMGYIRTNPLNIALIPFSFPSSFIGGKKVDFMLRVENFYLPNPTKESCIAIPMSVDERDHTGIFHMLNRDMSLSDDADYAPYEMKWSSAGFYAHTFGEETVQTVETMHEERLEHNVWTPASHVAHRCCVTRMDPSSPVPRKVDFDASGPGCSLRENTPGAELTAMGRAAAYPQRIVRNMYEYCS